MGVMKMKRINWLLWLVVLIVSATVVLIVVLHNFYYFSDPKNKESLIVESAKALLQLAGVAALGGWLKFLYDKATERRRQAEKANELRKAVLDELIEARSLIEEARRKCRLEKPTWEQYGATITAILEARLKLSRIWHETESAQYLFDEHEIITGGIRKMKTYLDSLINEYEANLSAEEVKPDKFKEFLSENPDNHYFTDFLDGAYRPAVNEIRKDLLRAGKANFDVSD